MVVAFVLFVWTAVGFGAAILFGRMIRLSERADRPYLYLEADEPEEIDARYAA